ncbi:MAG: flippase-like domain-containing protein [Prevotella sp.]|nr:flippase-like domain-containing protein [Prevotella sp.]
METAKKTLKILLPLVLGGAILYWMYRDFDFQQMSHVMMHEMDWTWMLLSFPFGILAQALRGWRWKQMLEPVDKQPRNSVAVNAVFLSYAASLVVPRIGEFTRCGVLKKWDDISFAKALGTVVTERAIDSLLVLLITGLTILFEMSTFGTFFKQTGLSVDYILHGFSWAGYLVAAICLAAIAVLLHLLLQHLSIYNKVKTTLGGLWQGIISLRHVRHVWLFAAMTLGIWLCYFLHYYLTFFCFDFTRQLGLGCALVTFIVGSIAVIVPTPNGAGPWHFAVKTMLILYGVQDNEALYFVLIVHTVQTLLVAMLGVWAWIRLGFVERGNLLRGKRREKEEKDYLTSKL